jgi:hypothetical protein
MAILKALLEMMKFLEFLTTPPSVVASVWVILYWVLSNNLECSPLIALLLSTIPMIELFYLLNQSESK